LLRRAERRATRVPDRRGSDHGGEPGRSHRCAIADRAEIVAPIRPTGPSDGEPLATLRATTLERESAAARAHPRPESVGPGSLALLRLVGAFHDSRGRGWRSSIAAALRCSE